MMDDPDLAEMAREEIATLDIELPALEGEPQALLLPKDPDDVRNAFLESARAPAATNRPVRRRPAAHVPALRRAPGLAHGDRERERSTVGGYKEVVIASSASRLRPAQVRVRRPPRAARAGDRKPGAHPPRVPSPPCPSPTKPPRCRSIRPTCASIPTGLRRRRPAREQDGLGGPHHAPSDRHRRRVPGRPLAAPQQGDKRAGAGSPHPGEGTPERAAREAATRKGLIGSGDRSDRIRTYNFLQGRMTDHRINLTLYKLGAVMEGDLDEVVQALLLARRPSSWRSSRSAWVRRAREAEGRARRGGRAGHRAARRPAAAAARAGAAGHRARLADRPRRRPASRRLASAFPRAVRAARRRRTGRLSHRQKEFFGCRCRWMPACWCLARTPKRWSSGRWNCCATALPRIVDLGTGSGAIALALQSARRDARVEAVDASPAALEVAAANALRLGLPVALREAQWLEGAGRYDLIVSNLRGRSGRAPARPAPRTARGPGGRRRRTGRPAAHRRFGAKHLEPGAGCCWSTAGSRPRRCGRCWRLRDSRRWPAAGPGGHRTLLGRPLA